jgi:DNA-binding CsgD family transcriptional regulator
VPAGRGQAEEAERHARLAEKAAARLDYSQERVYAAMARALVCQASGDYLASPARSVPGRTKRPWAAAAGCTRSCGGRCWPRAWSAQPQAAAVLEQMRAENWQVSYLQPALAWLEGWLAEQRGAPEQAREIYQRGEDTASRQSPVYTARLLLAHGRLLRRMGQRRLAVPRLRQARDLYQALRAAPFIAWTEQELAACGLRQQHPARRSVLEMTDRETEVAHLIEQGKTNAEIAAELFITPKAVEYHLGNIYAKFGLKGRQQLRRLLGDAGRSTRPEPTAWR